MKFTFAPFVLGSIVAGDGTPVAEGTMPPPECQYTLEIMHVQDESDSFYQMLGNMKDQMSEVIPMILTQFPGVKYAYSYFVDKPLPGVGYGAYGGYPKNIRQGACYTKAVDFTTNPDELVSYMASAVASGGNDIPEAQYEAIIRGALDSGWTDPRQLTNDITGDPLKRIMYLVTDAAPHVKGDAQKFIDEWNSPRKSNADNTTTSGGFGSHSICNRNGYILPALKEECVEMADLFLKKEVLEQTLTGDESDKLASYIIQFGPEKFDTLKAHPFDDSMACEETDYPSYAGLNRLLQDQNIELVVLAAMPIDGRDWEAWDWLKNNEFGGVSSPTQPPNLRLLNRKKLKL